MTVVAPAAPGAIWRRWTDFAAWPEWNPHCVAATVDGPLAPGTGLDLHLRDPRGRSFYTRPRLAEVQEDDRLVWEARGLGMRARTVTRLEPEPDGTRMTIEADALGPLAFTYRIALSERIQALMYVAMLDALTDSLRA